MPAPRPSVGTTVSTFHRAALPHSRKPVPHSTGRKVSVIFTSLGKHSNHYSWKDKSDILDYANRVVFYIEGLNSPEVRTVYLDLFVWALFKT